MDAFSEEGAGENRERDTTVRDPSVALLPVTLNFQAPHDLKLGQEDGLLDGHGGGETLIDR